MSLTYTYEIISVDPTARCMEVMYSSNGRESIHIGTRLPFEGETLEVVVNMYAPIQYWLEQEMTVVVPQVGATGIIEPVELAIDIPIEAP